MKSKKKKKKFDSTKDPPYIILNKKIKKNGDKLWIPDINTDFKCVNEDDTFFKIYKCNNNEEFKNITLKKKKVIKKTNKKNKKDYKAIKITILFNKKQKIIVNNWFNACINMYNETIAYIKNIFSQNKNNIPIEKTIIKKLEEAEDFVYNRCNHVAQSNNFIKIIKKVIKDDSITKNTKDTLKKSMNKIIEYKKIVTYEEIYNNITNHEFIRTYCLNNIRANIIENSQLKNFDYNTKVPAHILDGTIKLACSNYNSAISNYKAGHITHFRIRYWKFNKDTKILDVEQQYCNDSTIFSSTLGNVRFRYEGKTYSEFKNIKYQGQKLGSMNCDSKLMYDKLKNKYYLFMPIEIEKTNVENSNNMISIDLGVRNFINGISENGLIQIGDDVRKKIQEKLERIDYILDKKNKIKHRKKKERNKRRQLRNLTDELHWKSINYLTTKYNIILIGDLSAKSISKKNTSNITKMTKRIAYSMSYYKFRQRLEYKCKLKEIDYRKVKEKYTSKMCSICGSYNEKLGSNKIYTCINSKCKEKLGRDDNGSRCICMLETI